MWEPLPDLEAAASLGEKLRALGYGERAIEKLLGEEGAAADLGESVVYARRLPGDELGDAIRLLLLARPVRAADFAAGVELERLGLATRDGDLLVPRARVVPTEGVYLAFDTFSRGEEDPPGWVASFSPTAYWLASLTPRRRVERALDIGTGNGVHALLAARHAGSVVATDVNPRALAFTRISAAVNEIENVETRLGSLFDPVGDETFDLITCNAPYVISPERRWQYRDGGLPGDELSQRVVTNAAAHLAEGGSASVLVSWLAASPDDPDEHVCRWLDGNGCDAWILGLSGSDPVDHAAGWNEHLAANPEAYERVIDEWTGYFAALGAGWITEGAVVMRRRDGDRHVVRADPVDEDELEYAGDQIERVFAALAALARDGDTVLERPLRLTEEARFDQQLDREGGITSTLLVLDEGTCAEVELDADAADALMELGAGSTLDDAVARVSRREQLSSRDAGSLRRDVRRLARDLFEQGVLELA